MASAGARAYNGGLGAEPPAGSRGRAPGQGARGAKPPEAEKLLVFDPINSIRKYFVGNLVTAEHPTVFISNTPMVFSK